MITKPVTFYSEGHQLVGDVFYPSDLPPGQPRAGVVLCHGYTGIKDLYLPDNARTLMSQPDIDGALVGGASLDPRSFAQIVRASVKY